MKKIWIVLLLMGLLSISCEKNDEPLTGDIILNCTDDHYIGAEYNVITEYSFIQGQINDIYLDAEIRKGTITQSETKILNLNPGTYYITFYKTGWINVNKAVQVSAGRQTELKLSSSD